MGGTKSKVKVVKVPSAAKPIRRIKFQSHNKLFAPCPSPGNDGCEDCRICYVSKTSDMLYGMGCGHSFCKDCWSEYLSTQITGEGMSRIPCAAHNCAILVDESTVLELLSDAGVKLKYQHLLENDSVQSNPLTRWCPAPGCTNVIPLILVDYWRHVTCACGLTICFECGEDAHAPVKCEWLKKWLKRRDEESATAEWISANTKECPRCRAPIEKNGGCNQMTCRNPNCNQQFCWACLGPFCYGSYNCTSALEQANSSSAADRSRTELRRHLSLRKRYTQQRVSLKLDQLLSTSVKEKMEWMQKNKISWLEEMQQVKKAANVLCECRQTLMWTTVLSSFLSQTKDSTLLQDNQKKLESATAKLSEKLKRADIINSKKLIVSIEKKMQDCETKLQVLLDHAQNGYEKDVWVYNTTQN